MKKVKELFSQIYDDNIKKIYRFVYLKVNSQEAAEDICSETFLRGWQVFKDNKRDLENPQAFLYQIARNLIVDHYREKGRTQIVSPEVVPISDPAGDIEQAVFLNSDINEVKAALANINLEYQEVIIWHYIDEYSIPEIAQMMGKSEGAVRVKLHRALKSLKTKVDNKLNIQVS